MMVVRMKVDAMASRIGVLRFLLNLKKRQSDFAAVAAEESVREC